MKKLSDKTVDAILRAGQSPRYKRLDGYYRHWDGSIYDGKVAFLDMSSDVPLLERAPCIVYPIVRAAIQSNIALCLGLGKFPQLLSLSSEDDTAFDDRFGLSKDDSEIVDAANQKIVDQARLEAVSQQVAEMAMVTGTAVVVVGVDRGRIKVSQFDPRCCTPEFNPLNPDELLAVEISYRYVDDVWAPEEKKWYRVPKQFRRRIDQNYDCTYVPLEIGDPSEFPVPSVVDKSKLVTHGFGFCPVRWYQHMATVSDAASIDGRPIHWGITGQLDALHFALSQRHRAALYCGDPQVVETGVSDDEKVAGLGRAAAVAQPTASNPQGLPGSGWKLGGGEGGGVKRRKGVGTVWSYQDAAAKVAMMTLPGDALKAIDQHIADLRSKISEALGVVFIDPATLRGTADISGKALAVIYANQIARCNAFREDFWRRCLCPVLNLIYRVILNTTSGLYLAGADKLRPILTRFLQPLTDGTPQWFEPAIKPMWGDYFEPSDTDEATRATVAIQCLDKGTITTKTAVEHIKPIFAIQNVDQYVEQLAKEKEQKQADAIANQAALTAAAGGPTGGPQPPNAPPAKAPSASPGKAKAAKAPGSKAA